MPFGESREADIFSEARSIESTAERKRYLDQACGEDAAIR